MNRILDKLIILALSIFAMYFSLQGNILLIFLYVAIILSCVNYYLISRDRDDYSMKPTGARETIAFIIELAIVVLAVFYSPAIVLLPIIAYDITRSRNYIAVAVAVGALINSFNYSGISTISTNSPENISSDIFANSSANISNAASYISFAGNVVKINPFII